MEIEAFENTTAYYHSKVESLLHKKTGDHLWLRGLTSMMSSKMNSETILEDINCFERYLNGGIVLDFGAGSGNMSLLLTKEGYKVKALDINNYQSYKNTKYNKQMVEDQSKLWKLFQNDHKNIEFRYYKNNIPYKDNYFDGVFAYAVLEHIPNTLLIHTVSEIRRVLKPQGILFISRLPRKLSYSEFITRNLRIPSHEKLYSDREAMMFLKNSGFDIVNRAHVEMIPGYPERLVNRLFPIVSPINKILLRTPLKVVSHHLRFVCIKNGNRKSEKN